MLGSQQTTDISHLWNTFECLDLAPTLPSVFGDLHKTIICTHIDQALHKRRFCQGNDVAEKGG